MAISQGARIDLGGWLGCGDLGVRSGCDDLGVRFCCNDEAAG